MRRGVWCFGSGGEKLGESRGESGGEIFSGFVVLWGRRRPGFGAISGVNDEERE